MQKIGIGESDFRMFRNNDYYLIDKSLFIKDILDDSNKVVLITRPRRFGKTFNMSMLRYYVDQSIENAKDLFKGLKIMEQGEEYTSKLGYYPCIYMTLKEVRGASYEDMIDKIKTIVRDLYKQYQYILDSEKIYSYEKEEIREIFSKKIDKNGLTYSIKNLSEYLNRIYNKPVFLILDEYDVPLQHAYVAKFYEEIIGFFQDFYVTTFKDNQYLAKTVITGVSRVAKESIFTGANNFSVFTMLDNEFSNDFGITNEEMEKAIEDYGVQDEKEEIKKWYDGYRIGNLDGIYNPWSAFKYLQKGILQRYWANTSSNDLIKMTLKKSKAVKEKMERLLKDEEIEVKINQETVIDGIEDNEENVWGLFLGTGYLKVTETVNLIKNIYKVKIPNIEIKLLFEDIVEEWFSNQIVSQDLESILKDLVTLNLKEFEKKFKKLVIQMFSYWDVKENTAENFYHAFVLGMLVGLKDTYYINSNRESGYGRYDIMLEPKEKTGNAFIMEFKVYEDDEEKNIEETIENAKKQIEEKKYDENLRERGFTNITKMAFAFCGKECKMEAYV